MITIPIQPEHETTSTCSSSSLFALQVLDDSMAPEFTPGHVVVVDSSARLIAGAYVLVRVAGTTSVPVGASSQADAGSDELGVLRRWQPLDDHRVVLEALNQNWINECIEIAQVKVLGVIVQRVGRRRKDRIHYR